MENIIAETMFFAKWLEKLKNRVAKQAIFKRIDRARKGNFGDHKLLPNTGGIYEMRIDIGKGYRIYYAQNGEVTYFLLVGGNKKTQQNDINTAKLMWKEMNKN